MKQNLTTTEAAELLGCSKRTIQNMIQRGSIHATKIDPTAKSVYTITRAEVERVLRLRAGSKAPRPHKADRTPV